jgi:hypothetical protein
MSKQHLWCMVPMLTDILNFTRHRILTKTPKLVELWST